MKPGFVLTSNVRRFLTAFEAVEGRAAPEASFLLATGMAGFGKSRTGQWWALQQNAIYLRCKAAATPHWVLTDLVRELGEQAPARSVESLFGQAIGVLAVRPQAIVLDEVEQALDHGAKVLEALRDVTDTVEVPLILLGREYVAPRLKRHPQIWSRITAHVEFGPATLDDVRLCVEQLCEVPVDPAVHQRILDDCEGYARELIAAVTAVERIGKRRVGQTVTVDMLPTGRLVESRHTEAVRSIPRRAGLAIVTGRQG